MKQKIKLSLVFLLTLFILTSCTNEDFQSDIENKKTEESVQNRINAQLILVKELSNIYEKQLNDDFFKDVNSKELLEKIDSKKTYMPLISNSEVLNSLVKYNNKRLTNIKKIRSELGFTSIQSIADEINTLKILII